MQSGLEKEEESDGEGSKGGNFEEIPRNGIETCQNRIKMIGASYRNKDLEKYLYRKNIKKN